MKPGSGADCVTWMTAHGSATTPDVSTMCASPTHRSARLRVPGWRRTAYAAVRSSPSAASGNRPSARKATTMGTARGVSRSPSAVTQNPARTRTP